MCAQWRIVEYLIFNVKIEKKKLIAVIFQAAEEQSYLQARIRGPAEAALKKSCLK